jgi:hypothetical protein
MVMSARGSPEGCVFREDTLQLSIPRELAFLDENADHSRREALG